jgi:hypothetical protein
MCFHRWQWYHSKTHHTNIHISQMTLHIQTNVANKATSIVSETVNTMNTTKRQWTIPVRGRWIPYSCRMSFCSLQYANMCGYSWLLKDSVAGIQMNDSVFSQGLWTKCMRLKRLFYLISKIFTLYKLHVLIESTSKDIIFKDSNDIMYWFFTFTVTALSLRAGFLMCTEVRKAGNIMILYIYVVFYCKKVNIILMKISTVFVSLRYIIFSVKTNDM